MNFLFDERVFFEDKTKNESVVAIVFGEEWVEKDDFLEVVVFIDYLLLLLVTLNDHGILGLV